VLAETLNAANFLTAAIALFAALIPAYAMWMNARRQGWKDDQDRARDFREQLRECQEEREELREENYRLMRRLFGDGPGR
jgi:hypothetical protein